MLVFVQTLAEVLSAITMRLHSFIGLCRSARLILKEQAVGFQVASPQGQTAPTRAFVARLCISSH